jgi:hypothetical protein
VALDAVEEAMKVRISTAWDAALDALGFRCSEGGGTPYQTWTREKELEGRPFVVEVLTMPQTATVAVRRRGVSLCSVVVGFTVPRDGQTKWYSGAEWEAVVDLGLAIGLMREVAEAINPVRRRLLLSGPVRPTPPLGQGDVRLPKVAP